MTAKFDLLNKTELVIENISLSQANLTDIAARVAGIFSLTPGDVLVVDYRNDALTLDILNACVNAYNIVGKKDQLLRVLSETPGISVSEDTVVRSDGMLGWIAMDEAPAKEALRRSEQMASDILRRISKRVIVFSTGAEVADGQIEDTNTPAITRALSSAGYKVTPGQTLKDDPRYIAGKLREAADSGGYRLIITTGGVGAEDKDYTVEAIRSLDSDAASPYICHFEIGTGRHVKDGIRIAVGEYHDTLMIALPGPNDEVRASLGVLMEGLRSKQEKHVLAENIAANLRDILRAKISRNQVKR